MRGASIHLVLLAAVLGGNAAAMEPSSLRLDRTAEHVQLSWTGSDPSYRVFRSSLAADVASPSNEIVETAALALDDPLIALPCDSCFYLVMPAATGFACGELTCALDEELCSIVYPGIPSLPPQHDCVAIPAVCLPDPTCACVQGNGWPPPATSCTQGESGAITVGLYAP